MAYADYTYYICTYMGTAIEEPDFHGLSLRASIYLDYYTQGRAAKNADLDALKMACCAIAEQYQLIELAKTAAKESLSGECVELKSESVGSWSRSYGSTSEMVGAMTKNADAELATIARQYLSGTALLYRGRRCGC